MGRRKIEMEEIQNTNKKQVYFSKRRFGLFKKASELATLCNAEVGIVVFSPGDKPYSFGKPNFDLIAERFNNESEESHSGETSSSGNRARQEKKMCKYLNSIIKKTEAEKKGDKDMKNLLESAEEERFDKPIEEFTLEELTLEELNILEAKMKKMHVEIQSNINQMQAASSLMFLSKNN